MAKRKISKPKIFISYRRRSDEQHEDEALAIAIQEVFDNAKLEVFRDVQIAVGSRWATSDEKFLLASELCEQAVSDEAKEKPISEELTKFLQTSLADYRRNPDQGVRWEELRDRLLKSSEHA
ncbi:MAG: glycerol-3-phosphate O-acyltransferase [Verrucomicrobiales bacterium]|jgi:glycerol-3-phosphate O-acyltransferase